MQTNVMHKEESALAPALELGLRSVFLAGPFLKAIDPVTGRLFPRAQNRLERLIAHYEAHGCRVFNAHKREKWGEEFLAPAVYTRLDFEEISQADVLIAIPGPPASLGTHVELGWASAAGKPLVLLLERGVEYAGLVTGLCSVTVVESVEMIDGDAPLAAVDCAVSRALHRVAEKKLSGNSAGLRLSAAHSA